MAPLTSPTRDRCAGGDSFRLVLRGIGGRALGVTVVASVRDRLYGTSIASHMLTLTGTPNPTQVSDRLDGTYTASYVPTLAGTYTLTVTLACRDSDAHSTGTHTTSASRGTLLAASERSAASEWPVGSPQIVCVVAGAAHALRATLPSTWAVVSEAYGPIRIESVDAHGNETLDRVGEPSVELRVAPPLRAIGGAEAATPRPPLCEVLSCKPVEPGRSAAAGATLDGGEPFEALRSSMIGSDGAFACASIEEGR